MKFFLDGIWVYFPYSYIYPEQYNYMLNLKRSLDARGPCAIEMPTGTGKTVSLLSLIMSWILARRGGMTDEQRRFEQIPTQNHQNNQTQSISPNFKLIYCCRTLGEIDKTIEELKQVWKNIEAQLAIDESSPSPNNNIDISAGRKVNSEGYIDPDDQNKMEIENTTQNTNLSSANLGARSKILALSLSSRKRMCINGNVNHLGRRTQVDSECRDMIAPHIRTKILGSAASSPSANPSFKDGVVPEGLCEYYEGYETVGKDLILSGIFSFDDLSEIGEKQRVCPYYLARRLLPLADVIVYSYQYLVNPRIADMVSQQLKSDCIVVFDEAHNIDNVCIEALSVKIDRDMVHKARGNVRKLSEGIQRLETRDAARLQKEYQQLLRGLDQFSKSSTSRRSGSSNERDSNNDQPSETQNQTIGDQNSSNIDNRQDNFTSPESVIFDSSSENIRANPVLSPTVLQQAIPLPIRAAKSFAKVLEQIVTHLQAKMRLKHVIQEKPSNFLKHMVHAINGTDPNEPRPNPFFRTSNNIQTESTQINNPDSLLVDPADLQFCSTRLNSLLQTLEVTEIHKYTPIGMICDLVSLASAYMDEGFLVLMEPWDDRTPTISNPKLELACLDAQIAMKNVIAKFPRVVLTSGTLSPITMLPRIIGLSPVIATSLPMSLARTSVCPLIVTRGDDQTMLSTKFQLRSQPDVVRNYAQLLLSMAQVVPDGIVCFFPSYMYLEMVVSMWNEMGMLHKLVHHKLLFVETEDLIETQVALANYRRACVSGRGAVLLSVARGKVSEGVDFDHHYGRCVILFGIPFLYTESRVLKARLDFIKTNFNIPENDFLAFDAMRMASQCVGRVVRGKTDYGIMIFADKRYARADKRSKMPPWISQFISPAYMNLTTQGAVSVSKQFLKLMAQPLTRQSQLGSSLWDQKQIHSQPTSDQSKYHASPPPKLGDFSNSSSLRASPSSPSSKNQLGGQSPASPGTTRIGGRSSLEPIPLPADFNTTGFGMEIETDLTTEKKKISEDEILELIGGDIDMDEIMQVSEETKNELSKQ